MFAVMLIATSNKQQATSNKQQATSNKHRLGQPIFLHLAFLSNRTMAHVPVGSALITPNTNFYETYGTDIIQPYISDEASPRLSIF